jgi:hypothetical protein
MKHSGVSLAGRVLSTENFCQNLDSLPYAKQSKISNSDIIKSLAGIISVGKSNFEAISEFRNDRFFSHSMGIEQVPSSETLRQRIEQYGDDMKNELISHSADLIRKHDSSLSTCYKNLVPLDIDVSPFDNSGSKKEGVSYTYKGHDGYAPIFSYLGKNEGYLINLELREGSQHCQKGTPEFLDESIRIAQEIVSTPIVVRLDGGNDSRENIDICESRNAQWVIKRNPRKESQAWIDLAMGAGHREEPRDGKVVWSGLTEEFHDNKRYVTAYVVTERTIRPDGQCLLFPEHDIDLYWTSLEHLDVEEIVEIYHQHGTSEQFHSELKTDMDLERLPSGKFKANEIFLTVGALAYNVLRIIGQTSIVLDHNLPPDQKMPIRKKVKRRRIRSVIQDMIYFAGSFSERSREFTLSIWEHNPWGTIFQRVSMHFGLLKS